MARVLVLIFLIVSISSCNYFARENSGEVLEAFSEINEKLDSVNNNQQRLNDSLITKATNFSEYKSSLEKWNVAVENLDVQLITLKELILENELDAPEEMATSKVIDNLFFSGDSYTKEGKKFVETVNQVRLVFEEEFGSQFPELASSVKENFNINNIKDTPWLNYNFEGFPVIVSLTKFTQIQSDLKQSKQDLLNAILSK